MFKLPTLSADQKATYFLNFIFGCLGVCLILIIIGLAGMSERKAKSEETLKRYTQLQNHVLTIEAQNKEQRLDLVVQDKVQQVQIQAVQEVAVQDKAIEKKFEPIKQKLRDAVKNRPVVKAKFTKDTESVVPDKQSEAVIDSLWEAFNAVESSA